MRILFAGHKDRGVACLHALRRGGHEIVAVLAHPRGAGSEPVPLAEAAKGLELPVFQPANANDPGLHQELRAYRPDVTVMAGYSPIVQRPFIDLAPRGCLNLHGGRLPEFRGSSPMNWAILQGKREITLCVIQVVERVDAGDVLAELTLPVGRDETIASVQERANVAFPEILLETLSRLAGGTLRPRRQDESKAAYWPLRFPDDGLILWDRLTAAEAHNKIRALAPPYPGAFTVWKGRRIALLHSIRTRRPFHGEPGRVYRKGPKGLLVCASDRCLWIDQARFVDTGEDASPVIPVYERLATVAGVLLGGGR